jgi:glycerophosphoryl diester phosphodiesterase
MAAFRLALEEGAEGIELDVQMTADGRLVVIHDETLDRTTDGNGLVVKHSYDELRRLDASFTFTDYKGEGIPLLSQVLELLQPTALELNIELKNGIVLYEGMEEAVIRLVREHAMESRVVLSSFNHYSVAYLSGAAPDIESAILYESGLYRPWDYAATVGAKSLHPHFYAVTPEITRNAQRSGMKVRPWTVNKEEDYHRMARAGVDAVITNYPGRFKKLRQEQ